MSKHRFKQWQTNIGVSIAGAAALMLALVLPAYATPVPTCIWTGGGDGTYWSDSGNWSCNSGTVPADGDDIRFDNSSITNNDTTNNDLTGLSLHSIAFTGSGGNAYTVIGKGISLSGGIKDVTGLDPEFANSLSIDITLTADQTWNYDPSNTDNSLGIGAYSGDNILNLNGHELVLSDSSLTSFISISSAVTGTSNINVSSGYAVLSNSDSADFTGQASVGSGAVLQVAGANGLGSAGVTVADTGALLWQSCSTGGAQTINNDITIAGSGNAASGNVALSLAAPGIGCTPDVKLGGLIRLTGNTKAGVYSNGSLTLTGKLASGGYNLSLANDSTGTLTDDAYGYNDSLLNSGTSKPITLLTPRGTLAVSGGTVAESSLANQDSGYSYPLGLVNYTFTGTNPSGQVVLTFVTGLKPSQVIARKYDSAAKAYSTIPGAVITATTYDGQPALQLAYTIADNGPLDQNSAAGTITDPVGLSPAPGTPDTGYGEPTQANPLVTILVVGAVVSTGTGLLLLYKQRKSGRV